MTREEVFAKLNEIFQDVFDDEDINVNEATTAADVDGWDSFEHINLLVAIGALASGSQWARPQALRMSARWSTRSWLTSDNP